MLTSYIIQGEMEFHQLEPEWNRLLACHPNPSVFLTFEWLSTWWEHFKAGRDLFIVVAERDGRVDGIAPLAIKRGPLGRRLQFLGHPGSDYSDFIMAGDDTEVLDRLLVPLLRGGRWDLAALGGVSGDAPHFPALAARWESLQPNARCCGTVPAPYLAIQGSWDLYCRGLRKKLVADTHRQFRRLQEIGAPDFGHCEGSHGIASLVDEMVRLKRARYRATGARDIFTDGRIAAFYQDVADKLLLRGWLDLSYLRLNDTLLAIHFGFIYGSRFFYYMPSFRQDYARYSPGRLLVHHLVKRAFETGLREFDFLTGDDREKYEWTGASRTVYTFSTYRQGLRGRLLHQLANGVAPRIRASAAVRGLVRQWRRCPRPGVWRVVGEGK